MFSGNTSQVSADQLYVEDVFSTWLYTGTGAAQTITNGIDLAGKGGMVWAKARSSAFGNAVFDTVRGSSSGNARRLITNSTVAATTTNEDWLSFNSNGFTANADPGGGIITTNGTTYASWTFREAPKFFDVVTYTGTGANRTIAHNLGVAPGCILVKRTDGAADWQVYHRGYDGSFNASYYYFALNLTTGYTQNSGRWNNTQPTSTEFTVGTNTNVNASGATYVAYLFAHDTTSDGIIQCGSYTEPSSGETEFTLGWEPQWLLVKRTDSTSDWQIFDNMRAMSYTNSIPLRPNSSGAEFSFGDGYYKPTPRGFIVKSGAFGAGSSVVYIAIRRGPMKTPTLGTSVFAPVAFTSATPYVVTTNFPLDMIISSFRNITTGHDTLTRLTGDRNYLQTPFSSAEAVGGAQLIDFANNTGYTNSLNYSGTYNTIDYAFRRAPGFFDEVCWTGNGINPTSLNHNLGVAPELIITKKRNSTSNWTTGYAFTSTTYKYFYLNDTGAANSDTYASTPVYGGNPTSSVFIVGNQGNVNILGDTYVSYLFASCPGVSKVGSYTGNGSSQTINCGFAAGARFVMIKRTDSTGDWYVWDTARGIVAGNDPHLSLNTTAAEVTTDDTIDTNSSGFVVNQVAATNVNVSSATYIYLAIA